MEKLAERMYTETDFGRSVAITLSGVLGLIVYLLFGDWVITTLSFIIFFPIARLTATSIHARISRNANHRAKHRDAKRIFNNLSDEEKAVVSAFVSAGGCVLTWSQMNNVRASRSAIESLIQRELLSTSMTADGMRETFVLDSAIFDVGTTYAK